MNLWFIAWRDVWQHRLGTWAAALACALATALVMAVFSVHQQAYRAFVGGGKHYDAVLGARGSALQLVLNAVFHLETSPGNLPWTLFESIRAHPGVARAVPLAVGDNYRGYRIVGTSPEFFDDYRLQPGGRWFDPSRREAVVGSVAAAACGLKPGSEFHPYHGLQFDASAQHAETYVVTGILETSNTPADRVLWIPLEGVYRMEGHVLRGQGQEYRPQPGQTIPPEAREVSAVLLKLQGPAVGFELEQTINRQGKVATLAFPIGKAVAEVFDKLGWGVRLLQAVGYLAMLVATASILASVSTSVGERRRQFAMLRALGMTRGRLFALLVLEAACIGSTAALLSFPLYALIAGGAAWFLRLQTGVSLSWLSWHPVLLLAPLGTVLLAAMAGLLPARQAYAVDPVTVLAEGE